MMTSVSLGRMTWLIDQSEEHIICSNFLSCNWISWNEISTSSVFTQRHLFTGCSLFWSFDHLNLRDFISCLELDKIVVNIKDQFQKRPERQIQEQKLWILNSQNFQFLISKILKRSISKCQNFKYQKFSKTITFRRGWSK